MVYVQVPSRHVGHVDVADSDDSLSRLFACLDRIQAPITPGNALLSLVSPSHDPKKIYTLVSYTSPTLPRRLLLKGLGHVGPRGRRRRSGLLDDIVPASALPCCEVVLAGEAGRVDLCAGTRVVDADFLNRGVDKGCELCVSCQHGHVCGGGRVPVAESNCPRKQ
jgi:hypothetical protein